MGRRVCRCSNYDVNIDFSCPRLHIYGTFRHDFSVPTALQTVLTIETSFGETEMNDISRSQLTQSVRVGGLAGMLLFGASSATIAQDQGADLLIVADQVRSQGFTCKNPAAVEHIKAESTPDEAVYILECEGISYRVRLIPDQAAKVEEIK